MELHTNPQHTHTCTRTQHTHSPSGVSVRDRGKAGASAASVRRVTHVGVAVQGAGAACACQAWTRGQGRTGQRKHVGRLYIAVCTHAGEAWREAMFMGDDCQGRGWAGLGLAVTHSTAVWRPHPCQRCCQLSPASPRISRACRRAQSKRRKATPAGCLSCLCRRSTELPQTAAGLQAPRRPRPEASGGIQGMCWTEPGRGVTGADWPDYGLKDTPPSPRPHELRWRALAHRPGSTTLLAAARSFHGCVFEKAWQLAAVGPSRQGAAASRTHAKQVCVNHCYHYFITSPQPQRAHPEWTRSQACGHRPTLPSHSPPARFARAPQHGVQGTGTRHPRVSVSSRAGETGRLGPNASRARA